MFKKEKELNRNKAKISRQSRKKLCLIDAEDSTTALLEHSRIGAHLNKRNIDLLFSDSASKQNLIINTDDETKENSSVDESEKLSNKKTKADDTIIVGCVSSELKSKSFKRLKLF